MVKVWRRARPGRAGMGRYSIIRAAVAALAVLAFTGCESNAQRSAKLEKAALAERLAHPQAMSKGVTVTRENPKVKVLQTAVIHDENGVAAVVVARNESARALRAAPIAIAVSDAKGAVLYQNNSPGLDSTLVSVPVLEPRAQTVWIDDQIQAAGVPAKLSARIGEGPPATGPSATGPSATGPPKTGPSATGPEPVVSVSGVHTFEDPSNGVGVEGTVSNGSKVAQQKLVIYVVGRRGGRIVAAGRAVLSELGAGQSTAFQVFCIGSPQGAKLEASAAASAAG